MIELNQENKQDFIDLILDNINRSSFLYANISNETQKTFGLYRQDELVGLFNIVYDKYITYLFSENATISEVKQILDFAQDIPHIEGTVVGEYEYHFEQYYEKFKVNEIATLSLKENNPFKFSSRVQPLTPEYYQTYIDTVTKIFDTNQTVDDIKDLNKYYIIVDDNKIISGCTLTSISEKTAVITTVFTVEECRNQGLAKECISHLLAENCEYDREIMLFFTNPVAKNLYLNLGFKVNDKLLMFSKKHNC